MRNTVSSGFARNRRIYILEPEVLDLIPKDENYSFEYNVFPDLLDKKVDFFACILNENYWRDIGTPESYLAAHQDFLNGLIKGFELEKPGKSEIATAAVVDRRSIIDENCVIKPSARILNSVLGKGVFVEEKALVENSVVWSHTRISSGAEIRNAVIGRSCYLGKSVTVTDGAVLGDKTSLTDYTKA
jgi:NDP-sugar pyrophosphorylase family protein